MRQATISPHNTVCATVKKVECRNVITTHVMVPLICDEIEREHS